MVKIVKGRFCTHYTTHHNIQSLVPLQRINKNNHHQHSRRTNTNNPRTTTVHCGRPHLWTKPARLLTCRSWTFLRQTWGVKWGETVQQKMRRTTVKKQMNVTMTTVGTMVGVVKNIMQRVPKTRQQCQDVAVGTVVASGSKNHRVKKERAEKQRCQC